MRICAMWRDMCRSKPLDPKELQWYLKKQLIVFTIVNTGLAMYNLFGQDNSAIEEGAIIVSLSLVWLAVPVGAWGVWRENGGITALYVVFGILCGAGSTALSIAAAATVAICCQADQSSFKGCSSTFALTYLPCLQHSNCTRDMIDNYNNIDFISPTLSCDAWGTDDCRNAPDTITSMAFLGGRLFLLFLNIFTSCVPVYFAVLYFVRLESHRTVILEAESDSDNDTDDSGNDSGNSPDVEIPVKKPKKKSLKKSDKKKGKKKKAAPQKDKPHQSEGSSSS